MRSLTHRSVIATTLTALVTPSALATVGGYYNSASDQSFTITNMPDFDQLRAATTGILGLPNDGKMYCVPTSALNLAAYMANHGYPGISPGNANWKGNTNYNAATINLAILGTYMSTDPFDGTGGLEGRDGLIQYLANPYAFDVDIYYQNNAYAPNIQTVGQILANGGLANFCFGYWFHSGNHLTLRDGGHCVTPTHVKVSGSSFNLKYRDPGTGGPIWTTQSDWADTSTAGTTASYVINGKTFQMTPIGSGSGYLFMIDCVFAVYPFAGLTDSPAGVVVLKPGTFNQYFHNDTAVLNPAALGQIADLKLMPDNTAAVVLTKPVVGGPQGKVKIIDPIDESMTEVPSLSLIDPKASCFNRHQQFYIIDGRQLICVNVKGDAPAEEARIVLPSSDYNALACDGDNVLVLKPGPGAQLLIYPRNLVGTPTSESLPGNIPLTGKTWFDCCPDTKSLWLCSEANENLYEAIVDPVSGRYILGDTIASPSIVNPRCIKLRLCDQLIFACDGSVKEFRQTQGRGELYGKWILINSSLFGVNPGLCFDISRSNSNHDPALHTPEQWNINIDPALLLPASEAPSCLGDMDFDLDVDLADLQLFLFEFGETGRWRNGDFDQDDTVDLDDLQTMLFNFGTTCQ